MDYFINMVDNAFIAETSMEYSAPVCEEIHILSDILCQSGDIEDYDYVDPWN